MAEKVLAVGQDSPMVGRGRELHAVEQVLARLAAGRPAVVEVTGEPGIGKTRLLDELTRAAGRRGYVVARGGAEEGDRDIPYAAITHALDPLVDALGPRILGAPEQAQLAAMFPSLAGRRVAPASLEGPERRRLFTAVRALLVQLAQRRPLVLALDDLQWADGGSVELLSYLLRRPPAGPVLIALAYRPREVGATLASTIDTSPGAIRLELGPLSVPAASSLLDRLGLSLPPVACADLHTASGGNPCYLLALAPGGGPPLRARSARVCQPRFGGCCSVKSMRCRSSRGTWRCSPRWSATSSVQRLWRRWRRSRSTRCSPRWTRWPPVT